jgi:hypothetical protein
VLEQLHEVRAENPHPPAYVERLQVAGVNPVADRLLVELKIAAISATVRNSSSSRLMAGS